MENMFFSPSIRVFNSENAEMNIQRKPGATTSVLSRIPLLDRTVNSKNTPDMGSLRKSAFKKSAMFIDKTEVGSQKQSTFSENIDTLPDHMTCSYKDFDSVDCDILFPVLTKEDIDIATKRHFTPFLTPPPSPQMSLFDLDVPTLEEDTPPRRKFDFELEEIENECMDDFDGFDISF